MGKIRRWKACFQTASSPRGCVIPLTARIASSAMFRATGAQEKCAVLAKIQGTQLLRRTMRPADVQMGWERASQGTISSVSTVIRAALLATGAVRTSAATPAKSPTLTAAATRTGTHVNVPTASNPSRLCLPQPASPVRTAASFAWALLQATE